MRPDENLAINTLPTSRNAITDRERAQKKSQNSPGTSEFEVNDSLRRPLLNARGLPREVWRYYFNVFSRGRDELFDHAEDIPAASIIMIAMLFYYLLCFEYLSGVANWVRGQISIAIESRLAVTVILVPALYQYLSLNDPSVSLMFDENGSLLRDLPAEVALYHSQGQVDSAGFSSRRGYLLVLDEPDAAPHIDIRVIPGKPIVTIVMGRG